MAMNGPTTSPEKCCQYTCVGPSLMLKNTANGHEWAHCFSKKMLPLVLNGPAAFSDRCCRLLLMGSFLLVENVDMDWLSGFPV